VFIKKLFVQNDRVWSLSLDDVPREKLTIPQYQNSSVVMVWGPFDFYRQRSNINGEYYKTEVLKKHLMAREQYFCFQQDSVPSHTANSDASKICQILFPKLSGLLARQIQIHRISIKIYILNKFFKIIDYFLLGHSNVGIVKYKLRFLK
jgi:hypothetical protein